jgi:hypothetical protein
LRDGEPFAGKVGTFGLQPSASLIVTVEKNDSTGSEGLSKFDVTEV